MTSILCLAHYCDLHGPTPLMVTEGLPIPCSSCFDHDVPFADDDRPRTAAPHSMPPTNSSVDAITNALRNISFTSTRSSSVPASEQEAQSHRAALLRTSTPLISGSAIETPPDSPRHFPEPQKSAPQARRDSSYRKTYDDYVTKRANPCENCALTLPKDASHSSATFKADVRGPTLRTRAPYARVFAAGGQDSPPNSQTSSANSDTDGEGNLDHHEEPSARLRRSATGSTTSRSSVFSGSTADSHTHWLQYISTKEPLLPASFSIIRASCLRTLSFETLPRTPTTTTTPPGASPQMPSLPAFTTTHSAGTAASGGPIFFGDPLAGYTTAYIFRIPDVHARGHKRVYAFLALSTHRERLAMKTFGFIAAAFRDLAAWIQQLAEAEAERAAEATSPLVGPGAHSMFPPPTAPIREDVGTSAFDRGSSFLTGGSAFSRRMGGGGGGIALRSRGLAELVGAPDFFIQLHTRFVRLLLELGVKLNA